MPRSSDNLSNHLARERWDSDNDARQTHSDRDCLVVHTLCPLSKPELAVRTGFKGRREGWLTAPLVPLPSGMLRFTVTCLFHRPVGLGL